MAYQAKIRVPFGVLGIRCAEGVLTGIDFLSVNETLQSPSGKFAARVCEQLLGYVDEPDQQFSVAIQIDGTPHQRKVWQAIGNIPCGETRTYGELAAELGSSAQAVGQACGANPIPVLIPCHRVVAKAGLGGFMQHASGDALDIKRWLLVHEQR